MGAVGHTVLRNVFVRNTYLRREPQVSMYKQSEYYRHEKGRCQVAGFDLLREEEIKSDAEDHYISYKTHVAYQGICEKSGKH